jgi:HSP20 family protein
MSQKYEHKYNEKLKKMQGANNIPMPPSKRMNRVEDRAPKIDLHESEYTYFIRISLPGVRKDDLQIRFATESSIEIKGRVRPVVPVEFSENVMKEIYQGPFRRIVNLPKAVDSSNLRFDYQGGILEIYIHKLK